MFEFPLNESQTFMNSEAILLRGKLNPKNIISDSVAMIALKIKIVVPINKK